MNAQTHILVVAPEPEWQIFVTRTLRAQGYITHLTNDMPSALQAMAERNFDLIIVDAVLADLLKTLAWRYPKNRLLVVTATPSVTEAISAYRYGALDYVSKAFDEPGLQAMVAAALRKHPVQELLLI